MFVEVTLSGGKSAACHRGCFLGEVALRVAEKHFEVRRHSCVVTGQHGVHKFYKFAMDVVHRLIAERKTVVPCKRRAGRGGS